MEAPGGGSGGLVVAELLTGTFYLLMLAWAASRRASAHLAWAPLQIVVAAVVGVAVLVARASAARSPAPASADRDEPGRGETVVVNQWKPTARPGRYRGANGRLRAGAMPAPGHRVAEPQGNRLLVDKA
jgi:membrane protein implicated in regulation of membrane protease activity